MSKLTMPSGGGLDNPSFYGARGVVPVNVQRVEFDSGNARQYTTGRVQSITYTIELTLTREEWETLAGFARVAGGAWFNWTVCAPFLDASARHAVRFLPGSFTVTSEGQSNGSVFSVSFGAEFSATAFNPYTTPTSGPDVSPGTIN